MKLGTSRDYSDLQDIVEQFETALGQLHDDVIDHLKTALDKGWNQAIDKNIAEEDNYNAGLAAGYDLAIKLVNLDPDILENEFHTTDAKVVLRHSSPRCAMDICKAAHQTQNDDRTKAVEEFCKSHGYSYAQVEKSLHDLRKDYEKLINSF